MKNLKYKDSVVLFCFTQEMSESILLLPVATSGETLEIDELVEMHPEFFSNAEEAHILLTHLHKTGKIVIDSSSPQTMIKFKIQEKTISSLNSSFRSPSSSLSPVQSKSEEKPSEITEVDRSLAKLKQTEKLLEDEIDKLELHMNSLTETAKLRLKEGSRAAVSFLGSNKAIPLPLNCCHLISGQICTLPSQKIARNSR